MIRRFIAGYLHARSNGNSRLHSFWFAVGYVEAEAGEIVQLRTYNVAQGTLLLTVQQENERLGRRVEQRTIDSNTGAHSGYPMMARRARDEVAMNQGIFVTYFACGTCVAGASLDDGRDTSFSADMLLDAVRDGRRVTYWKPGQSNEPIRFQCACQTPGKGV